ncbi:transposase [Enterococcus faecalis]|nr:transposase [Enterococcus faecalis]
MIDFIDHLLNQMIEPYEPAVQLLQTIIGVKRQSAIQIISEIGMNITQFPNTKKLCSLAGLATSNNESAGKKNHFLGECLS